MKHKSKKSFYRQFPEPVSVVGDFVVHPSTSELAEQLQIDPQALSNENYSGIYDETGDYVPQFCDNPDDLPQSVSMEANTANSQGQPPVSSGGTPGQESNPPSATNEPSNSQS